jgi:hypothetical protein
MAVHYVGEMAMIGLVPKDWSDVEPQRRSSHDLLAGRHRFKIEGEFGWDFTAERGRVIGPSEQTYTDVV